MSAIYYQQGETIDYTATAAVKFGDVVSLTTRVGVAGNDIAAGGVGALHVTGVFVFPKNTDAAITLGAAVYWDATNAEITATSTNNIAAGYAIEPAAQADTTVKVKLLG